MTVTSRHPQFGVAERGDLQTPLPDQTHHRLGRLMALPFIARANCNASEEAHA
jgi:hypothetical protein